MQPARELSLRQKLMRMSILASLTALICASGAVVLYDMYTFRGALRGRLETDAGITAANSGSALLFDDTKTATANLKALDAELHVQAAALYRADGGLYAAWSRDPSMLVPARMDGWDLTSRRDRIVVTRPVLSDGERIGTIVVQADLDERAERFRRYLGIVILVALGSLLLAIPISARLQRAISGPIIALADTARIVSRDKDYSVRAKEGDRDETGQLVETFNGMLDQIERRDAELKDAHATLERRVEERTEALRHQLEETQRAREALRESELLLAEAQGLAHVGSWKWDLPTDRFSWSAELCRVHGIEPFRFDPTLEGFLRPIHPDDRDLVRDKLERARREGLSFTLDHRIVRPDGEVRTLHATGSVLPDASRKPVRIVGTGHDITDRILIEDERAALIRTQAERAEAEAAESRAGLLAQISAELNSSFAAEPALSNVVRLVVPSFADACSVRLLEGDRIRLAVLADVDARLEDLAWDIETRFPPGAAEASRAAAAIADGRPRVLSVFTEEDYRGLVRSEEHGRLLRQLAFRSVIVVPLVVRDVRFGVVVFCSRTEGRYDGRADLALAENIAARVAVAIENRRLYREAQEANRMKDEFLATLSHELRSPLNAIVGWAELLRGGKLDAETARRAIDTIDRNARAQAALIEDILDVSRIVAGKLQIETLPVDLTGIVGTVVDSVRPAAMAKGLELRRLLDPEPVVVSGDAARLHQVVQNLLSNAVKFTPKGGWVEVRLSRSATHAQLVVEDTGIGIEPEFLAGVFDRFRQADSTSTRVHKGLGLGLAIARHLVELHGGHIEGQSQGRGRGATFRVTLPLRSVVKAAEDAAAGSRRGAADQGLVPEVRRLEGVSILVVDDEADARELIRVVLERLGARVVSAVSAKDALDALGRERVDLLISDIEMPECDGYELIRRVRLLPPEQGGGTPAAALTAYARKEDRIKAIVAGFNVHLAKPVQPAELEAVAAGLTRRR